MATNAPFSLRMFVVNGDPDGLRVIDRTNWNGKALVFPRKLESTRNYRGPDQNGNVPLQGIKRRM